jgi:ornithine carbamoyltransferase
MADSQNLVCLLDYSSEEIESLIEQAQKLKKNRLKSDPQIMKSRTGVLIFEKPSLRTNVTFETAIHELGGYSINLPPGMVQMGQRESVEDVAHNLERWVHVLVVRTYSHDTLVRLAQSSSIPVINALTDSFHPCQALACALTLKERLPDTKKLKVAFIGDGNNVSASIMIVCARLGYDFVLACPTGYELPSGLTATCSDIASARGCSVSIVHEPRAAVADASLLYTDVWASMGQENEKEKRAKDFASFQINGDLLAHAPAHALVSHCLPAHRGEEITGDVLDSDRSCAFDEAENRLHVQKAVIVHLFS